MKKLLLCFFLLACNYHYSFVRAEGIKVFGMGHNSCANLMLALKANDPTKGIKVGQSTQIYYSEAATYAQWISGYATAIAQERSLKIDTDFVGLIYKVNKICEDDPSIPILWAVSRALNNM